MRRVIALASGLVVSTVLLGGGWLWASLRERETRMNEARERLTSTADAVSAVVDGSLEELRAREDQRQFYLYNYYYSPPDVLALTDPVAISPLARPSSDPRIVGYFQIDPTGNVRTPYEPDDRADPPELALRIRGVIGNEAFAEIRSFAGGDESGTMFARPARPPRFNDYELQRAPEAPPPNALTMTTIPNRAGEDAEEESAQVAEAPDVLDMNPWVGNQAQEIQAAQAGDSMANMRVIERGRQAPVIQRRDITWEQAEQQQSMNNSGSARPPRQQSSSVPQPQPQVIPQVAARPRRPRSTAVRAALEARRSAVETCMPEGPVIVRLTIRGSDGRPARVDVDGFESDGRSDGDPSARAEQESRLQCVRGALDTLSLDPFDAQALILRYRYRGDTPCVAANGCDPLDAAIPAELDLDNMVRREAEVDYTPMVYRGVGGSLVLHRVISHSGASVVQGLLVDREHLVERWIPEIAERQAGRGQVPDVVRAGAGNCAVRRPASAVIDDVELCFAPEVLAAATATLDGELQFQIGALAVLLLIAFLAASAIVLAARRADALSRQKSAFVSAVSHELRTPLTTLRMHAEMLEEGLVTDERRPKVHGELVRESVRLARLVDNVLSLSKLEEGQRRLRRSEGDLRAHVREVVEGQRRFVRERGFSLEGPEDGDPIDANFDRQAIDQIVVNLLDNAVKYGGSEAEKSIEVWVGRIDGKATIAVRDRGRGVPEKERRKVFERFHRVEREETAHAPGTGIGLALVEELAVAHGGDASVHPREGGGLEVRVRLGA
jgi:signal transduction histidine kinase